MNETVRVRERERGGERERDPKVAKPKGSDKGSCQSNAKPARQDDWQVFRLSQSDVFFLMMMIMMVIKEKTQPGTGLYFALRVFFFPQSLKIISNLNNRNSISSPIPHLFKNLNCM